MRSAGKPPAFRRRRFSPPRRIKIDPFSFFVRFQLTLSPLKSGMTAFFASSSFQKVNFSRPIPFFGRYISNAVLTTAGGLLTASMNDSMDLPNFIAPFLTPIPPSDRDTVIFYDKLDRGEDLVVQWDKHIGDDDDNRLHIQLRILLDGSMSFLYNNFQVAGRNIIQSKGYPILIGLRDGFSVMDMDKPKGKSIRIRFENEPENSNSAERTVYTYPEVKVTTDQIVGNSWAMITLARKQGHCQAKDANECTNECTRCQNACLYNIELHRSGSPCSTQGS